MDRAYYNRWADNDYEQVNVEGTLNEMKYHYSTDTRQISRLPESCCLGPTDGSQSSLSGSYSSENVELQESSKFEMNRYYGLTEVDSSLQDAIVRMDYVQSVLNKITLTNKSAEFCQLLEDFLHNVEGMRIKLQTILSPFANLEQFSTDLLPMTDTNYSTANSTASSASDNISIDGQK
uniref:PCM1_C domain-containing protein n=1 Tax=Loa loa TaxID=7209 RepID=A0A1I7VLF3_LOALO